MEVSSARVAQPAPRVENNEEARPKKKPQVEQQAEAPRQPEGSRGHNVDVKA